MSRMQSSNSKSKSKTKSRMNKNVFKESRTKNPMHNEIPMTPEMSVRQFIRERESKTFPKEKPNGNLLFDMTKKTAIEYLQYKISKETDEKKKEEMKEQLEELKLEDIIDKMGHRSSIKGGSRKRRNGTKRRAARKGKRKSNRNKK